MDNLELHQERIPPAFRPRPIHLLAKFEYRLRIAHFVRSARQIRLATPIPSNPLATPYARDYRQLIEIAQAHHIRLAICNFAMAVNASSPPAVMDFYEGVFPLIKWQIQANEAHSQIVEQLAKQNPQVTLINTHANLDGRHERFIDVVHFTQTGRDQLAETIFGGLSDWLKVELAQPAHP